MMKRFMNYIALAVALSATQASAIRLFNRTDYPIKMVVHFTGIGSPIHSDVINSYSDKHLTQDAANIKTRYEVWAQLDGDTWTKIIDKNTNSMGWRRVSVVYVPMYKPEDEAHYTLRDPNFYIEDRLE